MAYCEVSDVEKLTQLTFAHDSGYPDYEDVEGIIDDVAADLDGVAQAAGYDTPVTGTQAVALLKRYNAYGAAVAAWHAGFVSEAEPPRVEYWRTQYDQFILRLRNGKQQLPGLDPTSDIDAYFDIAQQPPRDAYFTGEDEPL